MARGVFANVLDEGIELSAALNDPIVPFALEDRPDGTGLKPDRRMFRNWRFRPPVGARQRLHQLVNDSPEVAALLDIGEFDQEMNMIGHHDERADRLDYEPGLMEVENRLDQSLRNRRFDYYAFLVDRKRREAFALFQGHHIVIRRRIVKSV